MYPTKGSNAYGQQSYSSQQPYSHPSGGAYSGPQIGNPEGSSQHALVSRQSSMLNSSQEADAGGYRVHSQSSHYGGPYASVYGSSTVSGAQQMPGKGSGSTGLQGRATYSSAYPDSSKFGAGAPGGGIGIGADDYMASGYSVERRHYGDRQSAYMGRDDPSIISLQSQKSEAREPYEPASLYRQQPMMKVQSLQPGPDTRQADYLAARAATIHHGHPDISSSYGGRMDADSRNMPGMGSGPYASQRPTSNLSGSSRGNIDHVYPHGSSSAAYGVGLPPSRDYDTAGKGLHGPSMQPSYQGRILPPQGGFSGVGSAFRDELKDDRSTYQRDLDLREERRRELALREREKERERELERERERDRERLRERERARERERERQRQRERERDRERERERLQKQREKERERERKRGSEHSRQDRSPSRTSKDRQASSAAREERASRGSPRRDTSHRRHSPVKDKRREYSCKVSPFCFADPVRDYMSLSKRYPRLSISPEFSKVFINWPKEKFNISLYTPVSFQHEIEVDGERKNSEQKAECQKFKSASTVWNAKVILMSGISGEALEGLCADHNLDERISHFNSLLKFAILRKDRSFMVIGGPWNAALDGGDPSADETSLIRTAKRYLKDLAQLNLENCQHWNKFIEIHYDRIGEDGLVSHKEITVLYLPNLSHCLPSMDQWRTQWLAQRKIGAEKHKKMSERDRLPPGEQKPDECGNDFDAKVEDVLDDQPPKHEEVEGIKEIEAAMPVQDTGVNESPSIKNEAIKIEEDDAQEEITKRKEASPSITSVRTFVRKKITRKVPAKATVGEDDKVEKMAEVETKAEPEPEAAKTDAKDKQEEGVAVKTTVKKKVIRRVIKKKVIAKANDKEDLKADDGGAVAAEATKTEGRDEPEEIKGSPSEQPNKEEDVLANGKKTGGDEEEEEKVTAKQGDLKKQSEIHKQEEDTSKENRVAESNEKRPEAVPEQPGLFFRVKQSKESRIRSMSLSLDGLLDYTAKDTEESTFELSLFAESLNEMIQFEMGRRLLSFLEKLRSNSLAMKKQQKRERDEDIEKEEEKELSPRKRLKSVDESSKVESECSHDGNKEEKPALEINAEEQTMEEDFEEPEEASDDDQEGVEKQQEEAMEPSLEKDKLAEDEARMEEGKGADDKKHEEARGGSNKEDEEWRPAQGDIVNRETLQAFRYFDRNQVGYLKAEDLRLIIHNLGLFLSQKEVKELVRRALQECSSSKKRDNCVAYHDLVRMVGL